MQRDIPLRPGTCGRLRGLMVNGSEAVVAERMNTVTESPLARAQRLPFGYLVFRDGKQIAVGHHFADAASAKLAALKAARAALVSPAGNLMFHVCYRAWGFQPFRLDRDGTATSVLPVWAADKVKAWPRPS